MKFLEDVEKLLKRQLPRAGAAADAAPAPEDRRHVRELRHERGPREERARGERHRSTQPSRPSSQPRPDPSGFDFSKPYEPAAPAPARAADTPPPPRGRHHHRPMPALLGGLPAKRGPDKQ